MAPWKGRPLSVRRDVVWLVLAVFVLAFGATLILNVMLAWMQVFILVCIAGLILFLYLSRNTP